jgi:plastocyanin
MKSLVSHRGRASVILLIAATIVAATAFAMFAMNFQIGSARQPTSQVNCANPCVILITSSGFSSVVVTRGSSVLWKNMDSVSHSISATAGSWSFNSGIIAPRQTSKPVVFSSDGTFDYYCKVTMIHSEITVVG